MTRRLVKAWLWHDKIVMEAAVRQLPHVMVTKQEAIPSGPVQVLRVRKVAVWNVLTNGYRNHIVLWLI